jgi:glycosyltransferase involved in cell wall biosynthesis
MVNPASLTIVVPVFNSQRTLPFLFNALLAQSVKPGKIIFVDNGSTDNTLGLLNDFKYKFTGETLILKETKRGPSAARNTGISHVDTELVGFFDSDVIPDNKWIENALSFVEAHPDIDFVDGIFLESYPSKDIFFRFQAFYRNPQPEGLAVRKEDVFWLGFAMVSMGLCKTNLFQRAGKFREDYLFGEDLEFHLRALASGARIYLNYRVLTSYHYEKYNFFTFIKSRCMYRLALAKILKSYFKGMLIKRKAGAVNVRRVGIATVWVGNIPSPFLLIPFALLVIFYPILLLPVLFALLFVKCLARVFAKSKERLGYSLWELTVFSLIETAVAFSLLFTHIFILFRYFVIML